MALHQTTVAALLLLACLTAAAARPLQRIAAAALPAPSEQPGNLTGRVLTRKVFKAQGGAYAMLGRPALLQLKRTSRFVGSVESLATHLETEKDLVSRSYRSPAPASARAVAAAAAASRRRTGGAAAARPAASLPAAGLIQS